MVDLSGTWLGTYWQRGNPTRFEATLVQGGNTLSGRLLDDGYLGEAQMSGTVAGHRVHFVKRYFNSSQAPIDYTGTVSEDGDHMGGQWYIGQFDAGTWEAHRGEDTLNQSLSQVLAQETVTVA
ncbi:MAG: hypothetical protein HC922_08585 [Leptolyngbyaceae cyanobacterium SM2_3_12]|nr:hypothetical protein [Leptolyngbyaceae cyanobacterium SM2_3_12]